MSIFKKPEKGFLAKLFKHKQVEELAEELAHTYADETQEEVCRFADNPPMPFTNNQAERDLRMVKLKNKIIGMILKSLTSTASKTGTSAFDAFLDFWTVWFGGLNSYDLS